MNVTNDQSATAFLLSVAVHIGLIAIFVLLPVQHSTTGTQTLVVTLGPGLTKQDNELNPAHQDSESEVFTEQDIIAEDLADSTRPWKGDTSRASFNELRNLQSDKPDLDWVDELFYSGEEAAGVQNVAQNKLNSVRKLLRTSPSTKSNFWPYLVKHLANNKYHDKQYPFSHLSDEHIVVLELGFEPNGMLVKAEIAQSSGDNQLDDAAVRSAYAANPYSPPPHKDRSFGYNYLVQIVYAPRRT